MFQKISSFLSRTQTLFLTTLLCAFLFQTGTCLTAVESSRSEPFSLSSSGSSVVPQLILDGTFIDNGRLAASPEKGCISGSTDPTLINHIVIKTIVGGSSIHGHTIVNAVTGRWEACFHAPVSASTTLYDITLIGKWNSNKRVSTVISKMSFGQLILLDGQSNMMYPGFAMDALRSVSLTNTTALLDTWANDGFYGITIMSTVSSNVSGSLVPTYKFSKVAYNWTRSANTAAFKTLALNMGWLSLATCIQHARQFGPTHCLQLAVPTTRIASHMNPSSYYQSSMIQRKPFSSAATEYVSQVGNYWYGAKQPTFSSHPNAIYWYQGESDSDTSSDYGPLLLTLISDLRVAYGNLELPIVMARLPPYIGNALNSAFNLTSAAQTVVRASGDLNVCLVPTWDLSELTLADGGLHWMDKKMDLAIRFVQCFATIANKVYKNDLGVVVTPVTKGPVISKATPISFDLTTGMYTVKLDFETDPAVLSIRFAPILKCLVCNDVSKLFVYEQWNKSSLATGFRSIKTTSVDSLQSAVVDGTSLTLSFVVADPNFGQPSNLVYSFNYFYPQYLITNSFDSIVPYAAWPYVMPLPAEPFSIVLPPL